MSPRTKLLWLRRHDRAPTFYLSTGSYRKPIPRSPTFKKAANRIDGVFRSELAFVARDQRKEGVGGARRGAPWGRGEAVNLATLSSVKKIVRIIIHVCDDPPCH